MPKGNYRYPEKRLKSKNMIKNYNVPALGLGLYSIPDVSIILKLPQRRIRYWLNEFWDNRLSPSDKEKYSWGEGRNRATSFYTLIEFYTFYQLRVNRIGVKKILKAHEIISKQLDTPFPFATSTILTDGKRIFFSPDNLETIIHADETLQFTISKIIEKFCKKIDFSSDDLAIRYWPLGKDKGVVVDPHHQFGQPIINNTNILAETIFGLYQGGEKVDFIARIYEISEAEIIDVINFFKPAA